MEKLLLLTPLEEEIETGKFILIFPTYSKFLVLKKLLPIYLGRYSAMYLAIIVYTGTLTISSLAL